MDWMNFIIGAATTLFAVFIIFWVCVHIMSGSPLNHIRLNQKIIDDYESIIKEKNNTINKLMENNQK